MRSIDRSIDRDVCDCSQKFSLNMYRYKYLEKMLEDEMMKLLVYLKGFDEDQRMRLAQITALWLGSGQVPANILNVLIQEHQVKDGTALDFLLELLCTLKAEKGGSAVTNVIKKSGVEQRLMDFFPSSNQQQTEENFSKTFNSRDLPEVVAFRKQVAATNVKTNAMKALKKAFTEDKSAKEIATEMKGLMVKSELQEQEVVALVRLKWKSNV